MRSARRPKPEPADAIERTPRSLLAPPPDSTPSPSPDPDDRVAQIEARLARIESYLRLAEPSAQAAAADPPRPATAGDLEASLGRDGFAKAGITGLGLGIAFTLSLPFAGLPHIVPSLAGYLLAGAFLLLGRFWRKRSPSVAGYILASAMALGYFSTLRLCFFGSGHCLPAGGMAAAALLTAASALAIAFALRLRSPWILCLALLLGHATALAVGFPWFAPIALVVLAFVAVRAGLSRGQSAPIAAATALCYATYLAWAFNNPFLGRPLELISPATLAPEALLACTAILLLGFIGRSRGQGGDAAVNMGTFFAVLGGYGLFLLHSLADLNGTFVAHQLAASATFLGLAVLAFRRSSGIAVFLCSMTGYLALTAAIVRAAPAPEVFAWLSVQSLVVVATAIWFRSRFIVLANFGIYLAILAAYVALARGGHVISIGFGVVALATARLLAWKRDRLELKTERMRNAYLVAAFLVFPYALYRLVPGAWVGLAWTLAAIVYYLIGAALGSVKYRWMGHATLLLTAGYLVVVGISRLEPVFRNLSFLILGAVLLTVSLLFSRIRRRDQ